MTGAELIAAFKNGLAFLSFTKKAIKSIRLNSARYLSSSVVTVDRLIEDYLNQVTGPGSIVSIEGFLSKYILTERPEFDSEIYVSNAGGTVTPDPFNPMLGKVSLKMMYEKGQYPVQVIPPIPHNGENIYLYMLYPEDMDSFLIPEGPGKKLDRINRTHKPIIIINNKELLLQTNKLVRITGVVTQLSPDLENLFFDRIGDANKIIVSNFYNPYREDLCSLCIDLRDHTSSIDIKEKRTNIPGLIYLETRFEGIHHIPAYQKFIGSRLPNAYPGLHWSIHDEISWGLANTNIAIGTKDHARYCYMVNTNLCGGKSYEKDLQALQNFVQKFRRSVQNDIRQHFNLEIKHSIDFIFDSKKSKLFHPQGTLSGDEYLKAANSDPNLNEDGNWIKSSEA